MENNRKRGQGSSRTAALEEEAGTKSEQCAL
jgi:hypothetical protein